MNYHNFAKNKCESGNKMASLLVFCIRTFEQQTGHVYETGIFFSHLDPRSARQKPKFKYLPRAWFNSVTIVQQPTETQAIMFICISNTCGFNVHFCLFILKNNIRTNLVV